MKPWPIIANRLAIEPRNPEPLNNIGVALVAKKQYAEAISYFQRALKQQRASLRLTIVTANSIGKA